MTNSEKTGYKKRGKKAYSQLPALLNPTSTPQHERR